MTRCRLRLCSVMLFSFLSLSLLSCSGNKPTGNSSSPAPSSGPPAYEGYHDIANCNAILAWGWDMNRPNDPVKLDIYDGNVLLTTVSADGFREDLLNVGKGNGKHAMYFPVPPQLKDGKKHIITIKFAGTTVELSNGPKELTCNFED